MLDLGMLSQPGGTNPVVSGHINYLNHVTGVHLNCEVESGGVTPAHDDVPATASFGGYECTPNSSFSEFIITVTDQGEPGVDRGEPAKSDVFTIEYAGMTEGGTILHGNIQVHKTQ